MYQLFDYQKDLIDRARKQILKHNVMIVSPPGSGKSVVISEIVRLATLKGGRVLFLVHRKELIDQIANSFKFHNVDMDKVDLLTVVKARNRLKILSKPNLIVTDEGHHGKAKTYQDIYDFYADVPRLGFTATPWRMSGDGFTETYDVMVEGHTVDWLIKHNRLADYRYYSILSIDLSKLKVKNGDYSTQSIDEAFGRGIFGDIVNEYINRANGQKAILYAHSIDASKKFAEELKEAGIAAVHVDSKTNKVLREQIMNDFREGKIQIICNVDLISEGFDVPDCSVTILCRPTKSLVLFLQQSMRSMRYKENKTAIILDHVGNWNIHGLPDTEHDWEKYFKGGWKKKGQKNTVQAKQCPQCSAMWPLNQRECDLCGYDFGRAEEHEKQRIEAELELIKQEEFRIARLSNKKFGNNLKENWEIAQARVKVSNKGKPLYKLIYYYIRNDNVTLNIDELSEVTGKSEYEINRAKEWLENRIRGN